MVLVSLYFVIAQELESGASGWVRDPGQWPGGGGDLLSDLQAGGWLPGVHGAGGGKGQTGQQGGQGAGGGRRPEDQRRVRAHGLGDGHDPLSESADTFSLRQQWRRHEDLEIGFSDIETFCDIVKWLKADFIWSSIKYTVTVCLIMFSQL